MDNLMWGLQMTVLGMGIVFALLGLLWGLLTLVLKLDQAPADPAPVAPAEEPVHAGPETSASAAVGAARGPATVQGLDAELVGAILVATLRHRAVLRREAAPAIRSYWPGSLLYASRWVGAGRARQNQSWQGRGR